jgi:hypothetical protein
VKCSSLFLSLLLTSLLTVGQSKAGVESIMLPSSRWVTSVTLTPITTRKGPGVTLEYGQPCLAEAGNRLRKLVHNFGRKGFVLGQYKTPYKATAGNCPNGTLFFLPEQEAVTATP